MTEVVTGRARSRLCMQTSAHVVHINLTTRQGKAASSYWQKAMPGLVTRFVLTAPVLPYFHLNVARVT